MTFNTVTTNSKFDKIEQFILKNTFMNLLQKCSKGIILMIGLNASDALRFLNPYIFINNIFRSGSFQY